MRRRYGGGGSGRRSGWGTGRFKSKCAEAKEEENDEKKHDYKLDPNQPRNFVAFYDKFFPQIRHFLLVKSILVSFYAIRHTVNLIEGETEIGEIKVERGEGHRSGEVKKKVERRFAAEQFA